MTAQEISKGSSLPFNEVEIIVSFLLKKEREFLLTHPETKIPPSLYKKFKSLEVKRLKNWPIAYLIGQKGFYGLNFKVNLAVLTPRPETEMIVEEIINIVGLGAKNKIKKERVNKTFIIDLGTGSGAIIIAVATELKRLFPTLFPKIKLAAVDISNAALKVAKFNAKNYGQYKKIKFYHGDLLAPLKLRGKKNTNQKLIIAANLPYLTPTQIKSSPSISCEPKLALDGGKDGLKYYRKLFKQLLSLNLSPRVEINILCEIDPSQAEKMKKLVKKYFPEAAIEIKKDLAGRKRLAIIGLP